MPEINEQLVREAFFANVIETNGTRRLVARANNMNESNGGKASEIRIWVPEDPNEDFNLVLSLCEDGTQRVTVDLDLYFLSGPKNARDALVEYENMRSSVGSGVGRCRIVTPSTSNWHVWGTEPVDWEEARAILSVVRNDGYYMQNQHKGFCSLRPPWENKYGWSFEESISARGVQLRYTLFAGIDWTKKSERVIPEPDGEGWEDLGWDDE